jgi:hypothetical protein
MTDIEGSATAQHLAIIVGRMLGHCAQSLTDLTHEQIHFRASPISNSIAFEMWHIARTVDNLLFFAFDREQPVWLRDGYEARFGLPKVAQGTGMTPEEAYALRFPEPAALVGYIEAVKAAGVPRLAAMTPEYLATVSPIRPWGERARAEHLWQVLVAHGNGHLGSVTMARALLGKPDVIGL